MNRTSVRKWMYPVLRLTAAAALVAFAMAPISIGSEDPNSMDPETLIGTQGSMDEEVEERQGNGGDCEEALVTAYAKDCLGCSGITADGTPAESSLRIIAADRKHWRMGTQVRLFFPDGDVRIYTVRDTGGSIKGKCRFDMLVRTEDFAIRWGRRRLKFEIVKN